LTHPYRPPAPLVQVQLATRAARLPRGADIPRWIAAALAAVPAGARGLVTVRLVGWREGRRLNENFRGREGATNVLAFTAPGGSVPAAAERELGDIAICLPLVHREAAEQGKRPLAHLAHLVVHGTLHLLGHDHHQGAAARRMEALETKVLRKIGFADPYHPACSPPRRKH
jgi:probable rRNA maturation factor